MASAFQSAAAAPSFAELRTLAAGMPDRPELPADADGATWLAARADPAAPIIHPRLSVFAASHGVAARLPGGTVADMAALIQEWNDPDGTVAGSMDGLDCDLRLYELAIERPTADSRDGQAMGEAEAALAATYGMMAVEPGIDLLVLGAAGIGARIAGTLLCLALTGEAPSSGDEAEADAVAAAISRHGRLSDPLDALATYGGPDIAALVGAILAARLARIPVILDGVAAAGAAVIVAALRPDLTTHCRHASGPLPGATALMLEDEPAIEPPLGGIALLQDMLV